MNTEKFLENLLLQQYNNTMTKQDYIMIAECIAECHNEKYNLADTIGHFRYRIHGHKNTKKFETGKFKKYIYELTKPDYIPDEQGKQWAKAKSEKL